MFYKRVSVVTTVALGIFLALPAPSEAQTCRNFVGNVCLDKKPAASSNTVRRTTPRATPTPSPAKPAVQPAPAPSTSSSSLQVAGNCVRTNLVLEGAREPGQAERSTYTVSNRCSHAIVGYLGLKSCGLGAGAGFVASSGRPTKFKFELKPRGRLKLTVMHPSRSSSPHNRLNGNFYVASAAANTSGKYPASGC